MSATISQSQVNIALASCEFFLQENNAGKVFANLRIPGEVQTKYPVFIGEILSRLEKFEGAEIIWRDRPHHGWYAIQFTSTLNHYISLAGVPRFPGRCKSSNLNIHRINTHRLLKQLVDRRNQIAKRLVPPVEIAPVSKEFPSLSNPWETSTEFHGSCGANIERGSGRVANILPPAKIAGLLPPAKIAGLLPPAKIAAPVLKATLRASVPYLLLSKKLKSWTKAAIAAEYLPHWSKSEINRCIKSELIDAAIDSIPFS